MRLLQLTVLALLVSAAALAVQTPTPPAPGEWPAFGRDPGATRYSPLAEINTDNVSQLRLVWTYDTAAPLTPPSEGGGGRDADAAAAASRRAPNASPQTANRARARAPVPVFGPAARRAVGRDDAGGALPSLRSQATPLMIDGILYLPTAYHRIVALDPDTGRDIWVRNIGRPPATRGIAYWPGDGAHGPRLVVGTSDAYLLQLDLKTGSLIADFGRDGLVDLAFDVPEPYMARARAGRAMSSQPAIYRHLAITGNAPGESPSLGVSGDIQAWDLRTGELAWVFHTIPRPGEPHHEAWQGDQWLDRSGANAWGHITIDEARGIAYVPLGTPNTDFYGGDRIGSNLYGSSLVALDAATGALKWHFQTTHHDNWDYDLSASPTLIDVQRDGQTIPAVAIYTKQGLLFMFDRVTGTPIYEIEERPVAVDNPVPGDVYWPTQPFPVKPQALARNSFAAHEIATVTPAHEAFCRSLLDLEGGVMMGGPYAQYGPRLRVIFPGWTGGGNWNGHAFDPSLGYLYFPSQDLGMLNKMVPSNSIEGMWVRRGPQGGPPGANEHFSDRRTGWPCQQPPWGELIAVNVDTGDVAWRTPLGSFEALDELGVPPTGTPNRGGPIATAGGLVFIGGSQDARFRAFDSRTGQVLWTADLSSNGRAVPMTYLGRNGRQYVAIMAGGGAPTARAMDAAAVKDRLHVFALP